MAVAHKVRNVCHLQLSNNIWLPPTDRRPRSRAPATPRNQIKCQNTTWTSDKVIMSLGVGNVLRVVQESNGCMDEILTDNSLPIRGDVPPVEVVQGSRNSPSFVLFVTGDDAANSKSYNKYVGLPYCAII